MFMVFHYCINDYNRCIILHCFHSDKGIIFLHLLEHNKISFMLHVDIFKYTVIYLNERRSLVQLFSHPPEGGVFLLPAAMDTEEFMY